MTTKAEPQSSAFPWLSTLKRWQTIVNTCNCDDVHHTDFISRWLVIARACFFSMTFTSGLSGVLLADRMGASAEHTLFKIWLDLLSVIGLLASHATNNLINDWTDTRRGADTEDYPRSQYSVHPVLGGLTTPENLLKAAFL